MRRLLRARGPRLRRGEESRRSCEELLCKCMRHAVWCALCSSLELYGRARRPVPMHIDTCEWWCALGVRARIVLPCLSPWVISTARSNYKNSARTSARGARSDVEQPTELPRGSRTCRGRWSARALWWVARACLRGRQVTGALAAGGGPRRTDRGRRRRQFRSRRRARCRGCRALERFGGRRRRAAQCDWMQIAR